MLRWVLPKSQKRNLKNETSQLTKSTSEAKPLKTHACKLASPSATNQILALPLSVSGTKPPYESAVASFPPIRVAQNELDVVLYGSEARMAVGVGVGDERAGAAVEVREKVAKDVSGCFSFWERGGACLIALCEGGDGV
jgi:hypothetical protein